MSRPDLDKMESLFKSSWSSLSPEVMLHLIHYCRALEKLIKPFPGTEKATEKYPATVNWIPEMMKFKALDHSLGTPVWFHFFFSKGFFLSGVCQDLFNCLADVKEQEIRLTAGLKKLVGLPIGHGSVSPSGTGYGCESCEDFHDGITELIKEGE